MRLGQGWCLPRSDERAATARAMAGLEGRKARGYTDDARFVTAAEIEAEVRVAGVLGGTYTPHCARVDPARLALGARRGVRAARSRPSTSGRPLSRSSPGVSPAPRVTARRRGRACDGGVHDTLPGREPHLPPDRLTHARDRAPLGGSLGGPSVGPVARPLLISTISSSTRSGRRDDRIALGGRGLTYRRGGAIRERDEMQPAIHARLEQALYRLFPRGRRSADQSSLGLPFRGAARLEHERRLRPGLRTRARGRLLRAAVGRVEPRRAHAG